MNRITERRNSGIYTNVRFHLVHYQLVTLGRNNGEPQGSIKASGTSSALAWCTPAKPLNTRSPWPQTLTRPRHYVRVSLKKILGVVLVFGDKKTGVVAA